MTELLKEKTFGKIKAKQIFDKLTERNRNIIGKAVEQQRKTIEDSKFGGVKPIFDQDGCLEECINHPDMMLRDNSHEEIQNIGDDINNVTNGELTRRKQVRKENIDHIYSNLSPQNQQLIDMGIHRIDSNLGAADNPPEFTFAQDSDVLTKAMFFNHPRLLQNHFPEKKEQVEELYQQIDEITGGELKEQDKKLQSWVDKVSSDENNKQRFLKTGILAL